jgi:hypothetical protein
MKKLLLFLSVICPITIGSAQAIYDDFDEYKVGQFLGVESNGLWTTWSSSPGGSEDTYIVDDQSVSPDNSISLSSGGVTDVVLPLGDHSSGSWTLSFMMRLTDGNGGYFNLLHDFSAAASNWAVQVYFSETGNGYLSVGGGLIGSEFVHPVGEWFEVKIDIDVDSDLATLSFDELSVFSWAWSEGSTSVSNVVSALNLYPAAPPGESALYHIDNVSFSEYGMDLFEMQAEVDVHPNPATDVLFVNTSQNSSLKVYSLLGKLAYSSQSTNSQQVVDCSSWPRGVYFVETANQSKIIAKKKVILY